MVKILEHHFEDSDDRSYGDFSVEAETNHGLLECKALVHSGELEEENWTLDGKPLDVHPHLDTEDYGPQGRDEDRVDHTLKYLQKDLDAWESEYAG